MTISIHETDKTDAQEDAADHILRRSSSRLAAVQALYQVELTGGNVKAVVEEFRVHRLGGVLEEKLAEADFAKFNTIVLGVAERKSAIDERIALSLAEDWTLERLGAVLRSILRAACFELAALPEVPAKVVISEYVDLAHAFFEGKEPGFVNGVLDGLARAIRPSEMEKAKGEGPTPPK